MQAELALVHKAQHGARLGHEVSPSPRADLYSAFNAVAHDPPRREHSPLRPGARAQKEEMLSRLAPRPDSAVDTTVGYYPDALGSPRREQGSPPRTVAGLPASYGQETSTRLTSFPHEADATAGYHPSFPSEVQEGSHSSLPLPAPQGTTPAYHPSLSTELQVGSQSGPPVPQPPIQAGAGAFHPSSPAAGQGMHHVGPPALWPVAGASELAAPGVDGTLAGPAGAAGWFPPGSAAIVGAPLGIAEALASGQGFVGLYPPGALPVTGAGVTAAGVPGTLVYPEVLPADQAVVGAPAGPVGPLGTLSVDAAAAASAFLPVLGGGIASSPIAVPDRVPGLVRDPPPRTPPACPSIGDFLRVTKSVVGFCFTVLLSFTRRIYQVHVRAPLDESSSPIGRPKISWLRPIQSLVQFLASLSDFLSL